jgi:thioredoxin-like negative regulator of GroEL
VLVENLGTQRALKEFIETEERTVIMFSAVKWSKSCQNILPVFRNLADEFDEVVFGQVDVDVNRYAAMALEITSVPTFVTTEVGLFMNRCSGAHDPVELRTMVEQLSETWISHKQRRQVEKQKFILRKKKFFPHYPYGRKSDVDPPPLIM